MSYFIILQGSLPLIIIHDEVGSKGKLDIQFIDSVRHIICLAFKMTGIS